MSLEQYRKKRDFRKTPEPAGKRAASHSRLQFVIQKHAASRLHYDFRLELDGTLKSWAVPKGPSLDPRDKRLAVQVEDHPLEYAGFEGVIPQQQYGAGAVVIWDRGTWSPSGEPAQAYANGQLKFRLEGEKLHGGWALVRMKGRASDGKENWLLIKEKDEWARPGEGTQAVDQRPESVVSGRTLEDLAINKEPAARSPRAHPAAPQTRQSARKTVAKTAGVTRAKRASPAKSDSGNPRVAGVAISHPERALYPEENITKLDVALYYERMAAHILPYIRNRPVSLVRCPTGPAAECFFQKHAFEREIPGVATAMIEDSNGSNPYLLANTAQALAGLAQMGTIELHVWGATMPQIERPDTLILDLDPDPAVSFPDVVAAARLIKDLLDELGLASFVKTTGGKGLHVVVPLTRCHDWDEVKEFARAVAMRVVRMQPERFTANMAKAKRKGKIFIDYLRNGRGATAVAPYSLRARPHATVAMPVRWKDLTPALRPEAYTLRTVEKAFGRKHEPWAGYDGIRQSITAKMKSAVAE